MERYGRIAAILNQRQVLLDINTEHQGTLNPGDEITAFSRVASDALAELGVEAVFAPKGQLRVTMQQTENLFLAEVFEHGGRVEQRPRNAIANLLFTEEVVIGATRSAEIEKADSLDVEFPRTLKVGDIVGEV